MFLLSMMSVAMALVPVVAADGALSASGVRPLQVATAQGGTGAPVRSFPSGAIPRIGVTPPGDGDGDASDPLSQGKHSLGFLRWMEKFDKARKYCPSAPPPCEESLYRETVFRANLAKIEAHNAAKTSGMTLGVTRFADLTEEEFSHHHTAYDGSMRGRARKILPRVDGGEGLHQPRKMGTRDDTSEAAADTSAWNGGAVGGGWNLARLGSGGARGRGPNWKDIRLGESAPLPETASPGIAATAAARMKAGKPHSEQFMGFVQRFGKQQQYCGADPKGFPCEESYRREIILLQNIREIRRHNAAASKGGMKKVITRFADLLPDEFAANHATYAAGPTLKNIAKDNDQQEKGGGKASGPGGGAGAGVGTGPQNVPGGRQGSPAVNRKNLEQQEAVRKRNQQQQQAQTREKPGPAQARANPEQPHAQRKPGHAQPEAKSKARVQPEVRPVGQPKGQPQPRPFAQSQPQGQGQSKPHAAVSSEGQPQPSAKARNANPPMTNAGPKVAVMKHKEIAAKLSALAAPKNMAEMKPGGGSDSHLAQLGDVSHADDTTYSAELSRLSMFREARPDAIGAPESTTTGRLYDAAFDTTEPSEELGDVFNMEPDLTLSDQAELSSAADGTEEEAVDVLGGDMVTVYPEEIGLPKEFDWRTKLDIGPLYSQGVCSGCWAYSTVQVIADAKLIATGHRPSPSPYFLLSCDNLDSGCNTGNMATAYAWIQVQPKGILNVEDFPTTSNKCNSKEDSKGITIDGFCEIPPLKGRETVHAMLRALSVQPVAVGMNVKPLQLYGGGLVQMADCPPASEDQISAINHAAVVVGWGVDEESKKPYFIIKNSYGQDWGENGYARIEMAFDGERLYGACGFFSEQNYPLTDGRDCSEGSNRKWSEQRGDDVYLMPDNVLILPNGQGILTPARIKVFGYDLTTVLKFMSFICFALCIFFLAVEVFACFIGPGAEDEIVGDTGVGSSGGGGSGDEGKSYGSS